MSKKNAEKQSPTIQEDESATDTNGDSTNQPESVVGSTEDSLVCDVCTDMADHLIMCDRCEIWFCYRCAQVDVGLINVLVEFKELHWFCKKCDEIAIRAIQSFNPEKVSSLDVVQRNIADTLVRVKNLNKVVIDTANQFKNSFTDVLKSGKGKFSRVNQSAINMEVDQTCTDMPNPEDLSLDSVENLTSSLANEQSEREKRKLNVIVYNVPESEATAGLERKEEDLKQLNSLFKDYLQVTPSITKVTRLGKRDEKPRLLKVSVALADQKSAILRNKAKLRKIVIQNISRVYSYLQTIRL